MYQDPLHSLCRTRGKRGTLASMPQSPDYAALPRGQIAALDRINAGEAGLPVLTQIVRLAQDVLGGRGGVVAEYSPGHARIIAATGVCAGALGRRIDQRLSGALDSAEGLLAQDVEGGDLRGMLGAQCEMGGATGGALHVYYGDTGEPGPEHHAVLELLGGFVRR